MTDIPKIAAPALTGDERDLLDWASIAQQDVEEIDRKMALAKRIYVPTLILGALLGPIAFGVARAMLQAHPMALRLSAWGAAAISLVGYRLALRWFNRAFDAWFAHRCRRSQDRMHFERDFLAKLQKRSAR